MSIKVTEDKIVRIGKVKKLYDDAVIPTRGSSDAAGYDLYCHNIIGENGNTLLKEKAIISIPPHATIKIGTGIAVTPPIGHFGAVFARSGIATKRGLRPSNCVGICDYDYCGEYIVALHNDTDEIQEIAKGERIAQLVFMPYANVTLFEVDELEKTDRGSNGFGSTGTR